MHEIKTSKFQPPLFGENEIKKGDVLFSWKKKILQASNNNNVTGGLANWIFEDIKIREREREERENSFCFVLFCLMEWRCVIEWVCQNIHSRVTILLLWHVNFPLLFPLLCFWSFVFFYNNYISLFKILL